ncbi:MAG: PD-(D/E)XK nuclease family protein, partial [Pseudomonadota bacterium]
MPPKAENEAMRPTGLLQDPEIQRLVAFARSDSPLIALGVERREVAWTQFMAFVLDPLRRPPEDALAALQALVDRSGGGRVDRIDRVSAEVKEGKHGRSDVAVECVIDGQPTALIIENKIDTTERPDQLAGYIQNRGDGAENVRGLLIELGDRPVGSPSFPAWDRLDAEAWLNAVMSTCNSFHPLVAAYRDLFEVWDLAARLRVERLAEIEAINYSNVPPVDWPLVRGWLQPGDTPFFDAVLAEPALRALVERLDLETEVEGRRLGNHGHLKLTKASWTIHPEPNLEEGINIHFEAAGRDRVRLDVEVYPYKGLSKNPELQAKFASLLPTKTAVH